MNRRNFLKKSMYTFLEVSLFQSLISNITSCSNILDDSSRNLVTIFLPGGPSRWGYDLFLNPYGKSGVDLNLNSGMANSYLLKNGRYTDSEYILKLDKEHGIHLPPIWHSDIPTSNGNYIKASSVLKNLISIQGIDMENGAHFNCQKKFFYSGGNQSLHGLAADVSNLPIDSFSLFTQQDFFRSSNGKNRLNIFNTKDNEKYLLNSFTDSFNKKRISLSKNYSEIKELEKGYDKVRNSIKSSNAREKFERIELIFDKVDIDNLWQNKVNKYKKVIKKSLKMALTEGSLAGITDFPIGSTGARKRNYSFGGQNIGQDHRDLRSMFDYNLSYPEHMADHFAFAEIVLELKISNNIIISPGEFVFLRNTNGVCKKSITHSFDEHSYGIMNTILINGLYNYALTSCLNEFIENLKLSNHFDKTIICSGSEFNRSPRINGSGSDHGWNGASLSIFSGLVKKGPVFIGDLGKENHEVYKGFWGKGTNSNEFLNGDKMGIIKIKNIHSTIATALNVPSPHPNFPSLIKKGSTKDSLDTALKKSRVLT